MALVFAVTEAVQTNSPARGPPPPPWHASMLVFSSVQLPHVRAMTQQVGSPHSLQSRSIKVQAVLQSTLSSK